MIEDGEVVIPMGDQRLVARIEAGRLVDAWAVNDLAAVSRDARELGAAIARADGAAMILRGGVASGPRELSAHERMRVMAQLHGWRSE